MGFMQNIRRAFGLDDDIRDEDSILADATPPSQPRDIHGATPQPAAHLHRPDEDGQPDVAKPQAEQASSGDVAPVHVCPEAIFNTVVNLFDNSLPSFIGDNLDRDAQCRHIYELLDESVRKYIDDVGASAEAACREQFSRERTRMLSEMEQLRQDNRSARESGESCKQQQLSAERQKRALTERVRDLEQQVSALSAEREQFELENKSLVNKLRLVSVQEGDADALRQENTGLRAELQRLRAQGGADPAEAREQPDAALQGKLDEALGQLAEAGERAEAAIAEAVGLRGRLEALTADRQQLQKVYDELKTKEEMTDVMINDLNSRASEAQRELAEVRAELGAAGDAARQVEQLTRQCDSLRQANESLKADAERGKAAVGLLSEVQEQLDKFEQSRKAREERINDLLDQLDVKDEEIDELNRRVAELNDALEATRARRGAEDGTDDTTAFDPSLDDTDWLVATPPPGTPVRTPGVTDDEFGYHEPKRRKSVADDPAQMSLFD